MKRELVKFNIDFSHDLSLGQLGENLVGEILSNSNIEVKTDYKALETGNLFVEYESRNKPSGISTTKADYYVFLVSNTRMITINSEDLKQICRKHIGTKRDIRGGDNNTSKGILLPITDIFKK